MKDHIAEKVAMMAVEIYNSIRLSDRTPLRNTTMDADKDAEIFGEASRRAAAMFGKSEVSDSAILATAREIENKFNL